MSFGVLMYLPSEHIEECKSTDQNVADVPSGDLISREEAIETVQTHLDILINSRRHGDDFTFINVLTDIRNKLSALTSAEKTIANNCDLISRQDAIDVVCRTRCGDKAKGCPAHSCPVIEEFESLPSAETHEIRTETHECVKKTHDTDLISRAEVLAVINKAMYNTDNKDIQDYLFCGLRRDVHHLPSADRPKGEVEE